MCGIVGLVSQQQVAQTIYDALLVLQHRGQDSAGIVVCDDKKLNLRKDNGQVSDVFHTRHMRKLIGNMGIGHVRYPTAGCSSSAEAQPFYVNSPYGITLAHNGNLTNVEQLKGELYQSDLRHINTESDSEVLLNVFAHELQSCGSLNLSPEEIFTAVTETHKRIEGAYAVVVMLTGKGIVGFRDPHGIRPIVYGKRDGASGSEYMIASESVALQASGFELVADLKPGEVSLEELERVFQETEGPDPSLDNPAAAAGDVPEAATPEEPAAQVPAPEAMAEPVADTAPAEKAGSGERKESSVANHPHTDRSRTIGLV